MEQMQLTKVKPRVNRKKKQKRSARKNKSSRPVAKEYRNPRAIAQDILYQPSAVKISKCAQLFIKALTNPFGDFPELPCIPDYRSIPSFKISARLMTTMTVGTGNFGFVAFNPFMMICNNQGVNSTGIDFPVVSSNSTYTAQNIDYSTVSGAIPSNCSAANGNSPFVTATFLNKNLQYRLVGAGVRIKYTGTVLQKGGRMVVFRNPGLPDMPQNSLFTFNSLAQTSTSGIRGPDEGWVNYISDNGDYYDYYPHASYQPSLGSADHRNLIIIVDGAPSQNTYLVEARAFYEIAGPNVPLTRSESDITGFGAIIASTPAVLPQGSPEQAERTLLKRVSEEIWNSSSRVLSAVGSSTLKGIENTILANLNG